MRRSSDTDGTIEIVDFPGNDRGISENSFSRSPTRENVAVDHLRAMVGSENLGNLGKMLHNLVGKYFLEVTGLERA